MIRTNSIKVWNIFIQKLNEPACLKIEHMAYVLMRGGRGYGDRGCGIGGRGCGIGGRGCGIGGRGGGKRGNCGRGSGKIGGRNCFFFTRKLIKNDS